VRWAKLAWRFGQAGRVWAVRLSFFPKMFIRRRRDSSARGCRADCAAVLEAALQAGVSISRRACFAG
jgi:hypothetical protein